MSIKISGYLSDGWWQLRLISWPHRLVYKLAAAWAGMGRLGFSARHNIHWKNTTLGEGAEEAETIWGQIGIYNLTVWDKNTNDLSDRAYNQKAILCTCTSQLLPTEEYSLLRLLPRNKSNTLQMHIECLIFRLADKTTYPRSPSSNFNFSILTYQWPLQQDSHLLAEQDYMFDSLYPCARPQFPRPAFN